jgi:hypothetical protein
MTSTSESTGAAEGEIFKTDTVGRVRVSRARREALLDEFERSGASGAQFAAYVGGKHSTFAAWANKRRHQKAPGVGVPSGESTQKAAEPVRWWETVLEAQVRVRAPMRRGCCRCTYPAAQRPSQALGVRSPVAHPPQKTASRLCLP